MMIVDFGLSTGENCSAFVDSRTHTTNVGRHRSPGQAKLLRRQEGKKQ
jgi:hypothetical protein